MIKWYDIILYNTHYYKCQHATIRMLYLPLILPSLISAHEATSLLHRINMEPYRALPLSQMELSLVYSLRCTQIIDHMQPGNVYPTFASLFILNYPQTLYNFSEENLRVIDLANDKKDNHEIHLFLVLFLKLYFCKAMHVLLSFFLEVHRHVQCCTYEFSSMMLLLFPRNAF